jgi:hypothetical protein
MWKLFIVRFFDWWELQFDKIWSILDQIWSKKIKNKTAIFILSVNVTTFYSNILRLVRKSNLIKFDQVWTDLIQKNQKQNSHFFLFKNVTTLYNNIFWYVHPLGRIFFCRKTERQDRTGQDGNAHRHRSSNSSLDSCKRWQIN